MNTKVVNLRNSPYEVYIGRAGHGRDGYFGNPHLIGLCPLCGEEHTRDEAIAEFKKDFLVRIERDAEFRRRVLELKGKILACFCAPKNCHGNVYKEWLDNVPKA